MFACNAVSELFSFHNNSSAINKLLSLDAENKLGTKSDSSPLKKHSESLASCRLYNIYTTARKKKIQNSLEWLHKKEHSKEGRT